MLIVLHRVAVLAQRLRVRLQRARLAGGLALQLRDERAAIVTVVGDVLADQIVGHGGERLFHLVEQLHGGDVRAAARARGLDGSVRCGSVDGRTAMGAVVVDVVVVVVVVVAAVR